MSATLRPHQKRLLEQIDAGMSGGCKRIIAQAPTGFGKTIVAAHRLRLLQDAGKRAIFIVPALSLIDQSVEKFYAEGVRDVGVIQANHLILVADVVTTWLERAQGRQTLCFAVDRAHAKALQRQFQTAQVSAEYIDCYTEAPERNAIAKRFHAREVQVVCNVGCLTTGIDWDVRCIILARPTKSEILYVQMIGRGLRTALGKADCLILDHSDNHIRLGFVTDIHHDHLDHGKAPKSARRVMSEALPKKCAKCTFLKPPKMLACPCCGFVPVPQPKAVHCDGELVELTSRRSMLPPSAEERGGFYRELRAVAQLRGYRDGWAGHKYREKFGSFPPSEFRHPKALSDATFRWIKSRNIAWARAAS